MEKTEKILLQFEKLDVIEPTAEWNRKLMLRLDHSKHYSGKINSVSLLLMVVVFLLAINIFSFSITRRQNYNRQKSSDLKSIASEFLIITNSSKY